MAAQLEQAKADKAAMSQALIIAETNARCVATFRMVFLATWRWQWLHCVAGGSVVVGPGNRQPASMRRMGMHAAKGVVFPPLSTIILFLSLHAGRELARQRRHQP